jgi:hypothetical protein
MPERQLQELLSRRSASMLCVASCSFFLLLFCDQLYQQISFRSSEFEFRETGAAILLTLGAAIGGALAAWSYKPLTAPRFMAYAMRFCAVLALTTLVLPFARSAALLAPLLGIGMGFLVVLLLCALRAATGRSRLGRSLGLGLGLGLLLCNLPWFLLAPQSFKTIISSAAVMLGSLLAGKVQPRHDSESGSTNYDLGTMKLWLGIFAALSLVAAIGRDLFMHAPTAKAVLWRGGSMLWLNALLGFACCYAAGLLLDKGRNALLGLLSCGLLAFAALGVGFLDVLGFWPKFAHSAGVALLLCCMCYYVARSGRPWLAAAACLLSTWLPNFIVTGLFKPGLLASHEIILALAIFSLCALGWHWHTVGRFRRGT